MNRRISVVTAGFILTIVVLSLVAIQQDRRHQRTLHELKDQVAHLENRTRTLQNQLSELTGRQPALTVPWSPTPNSLITPENPPAEPSPLGRPFEFNGQIYYVTPLAETAELSANGGNTSRR
jgi:hypothetical protein